MKVVAADSGCGIISDDYRLKWPAPLTTTAILTELPIRNADANSHFLCEPLYRCFYPPIRKTEDTISAEIDCSKELLKKSNFETIDEMHIDVTYKENGKQQELELDEIDKKIQYYKPKGGAYYYLIKNKCNNIKYKYNINKILALGKLSQAIRIAELLCGVYGFISILDYIIKNNLESVKLGLPEEMMLQINGNQVRGVSLNTIENSAYLEPLFVYAEMHSDIKEKLELISYEQYVNPVALVIG